MEEKILGGKKTPGLQLKPLLRNGRNSVNVGRRVERDATKTPPDVSEGASAAADTREALRVCECDLMLVF